MEPLSGSHWSRLALRAAQMSSTALASVMIHLPHAVDDGLIDGGHPPGVEHRAQPTPESRQRTAARCCLPGLTLPITKYFSRTAPAASGDDGVNLRVVSAPEPAVAETGTKPAEIGLMTLVEPTQTTPGSLSAGKMALRSPPRAVAILDRFRSLQTTLVISGGWVDAASPSAEDGRTVPGQRDSPADDAANRWGEVQAFGFVDGFESAAKWLNTNGRSRGQSACRLWLSWRASVCIAAPLFSLAQRFIEVAVSQPSGLPGELATQELER